MIDRKYLMACGGILVLFAIGLVLFFIFSANYADGLEKTMEEADAGEESTFESPFQYGENYPHAFVSGILGFLVMFLLMYVYGKAISDKEIEDGTEGKQGPV